VAKRGGGKGGKAGGAGGKAGGEGDLPRGAGGFCLAARVTTDGGAGDLPCGAATTAGGAGDFPCGAGVDGRRRGQGRQRPAARAVRLAARARAATAGGVEGPPGGAGAKPGGDVRKRQGLTPRYTSMVDPAVMAVDGGNANGEAHVAHAVTGDGPDVNRSTELEMYVSLSLAARSARTLVQPRWSMDPGHC